MQAIETGSRVSRRPVAHRAAVSGVSPLVPRASLFAVAALLSALTACKEKPRPQRASPVVAIDTVRRGLLPYIVAANGEVEANRSVAVQSQVSGMLTRVAIAEGDEVSQGQVLFQIDLRPFRAEVDRVQGTLSRDLATLARSRADSTRFAALAKDGYITTQALDQAFAEASSLAATVLAGRASLEAARLNLENTTIRAPISGRTGQLAIKAGNLVRAQSVPALVTINELRPVLVRFSVPERDFEELRKRSGLDRPLRVRVTPSVSDTSRAVMGTLTFIDNIVDRATGSVLLKARVANESRDLWPGQFVSVGLELNVDSQAVTVPSVAVVTTAAGSFVFVVDDSSKARRVAVKVGRQAGAVTKVDSGLAGGELVIIDGQTRLTDGTKIEIRRALLARAGAKGGTRAPGSTRRSQGDSADGDSARVRRAPAGTKQ